MLCIEKYLPNEPIVTLDPNAPHKRLALIKSKQWNAPVRLKVAFIDNPQPPANLRARILGHMNAWSPFCDVHFSESSEKPEVRITLKDKGYWSYVGIGILGAGLTGQATMCLEGFTMETPESEFRRFVRHETGHTLGFTHEHLRVEVINWIDKSKAILFYKQIYGWDKAKTKANVLTPLPVNDLTASATVDFQSIMCYHISRTILKEGAPVIKGGVDITRHDKALAALIYPLPSPPLIKTEHPAYTQAFLSPAKRIGIADIVGFGVDGVTVVRISPKLSTVQVVKDFCYNKGWDRNTPRLLADITGTGTKDIVGFGGQGIYVSVNNGDATFGQAQLVLSNFGAKANAGTWHVDKHLRFALDIRGTGRADILGFGRQGVLLSKNNGKFDFSEPKLALHDFGFEQGWRLDRHLRCLGDTTGDGRPDIVGFGSEGVYVAKNNGDGTFKKPELVVKDMGFDAGWRIDKHPRTIADMTGDGRMDIVGFGNPGVFVALNNGDGTFQAPRLVLPSFGYLVDAGNWRVEDHLRFIADVTGSGSGDLVGFGHVGVWVAINNDDGTFQHPKLVVEEFGNVNNWRVESHVRLPVDLTGDGKADIIGIGSKDVMVAYNLGNGEFGPDIRLATGLSEWNIDKTLRIVTNVS